jgi:putative phosphoribosyl transferase
VPFTDRTDAGKRLADALSSYRGENPVVLALPRGGVPVGAEVARALAAPLGLMLVRKIGAPGHVELAMGAVVDGTEPIVVRNEDVIASLRVSDAAFDAVCQQEVKEIERRRQRYMGGRTPVDVADRTVIVVDDGIATGATTRAALRGIRARKPRKLVLAVPVAPNDTLAAMRAEVDELICLESYDFFGAIGAYYADFGQVSDEEVIALLAASRSTEPKSRDNA